MTFQVVWLLRSKRLIEEQFEQKVNMAIGGALADFNASHHTDLNAEGLNGCQEDDVVCLPGTQLTRADQAELEENLQGYMSYYGIDQEYNVDIIEQTCKPKEGAYCCTLDKVGGYKSTSSLGVTFLGRDDYLYREMAPMIISSIVIFLVLASVSFLILWSLIKQKRITANNIDFFNNTAHELKTPLTNISLALKLLKQKNPDMQGTQFADIIKEENTRLSEQIERVLFLSKMENGEYKLEKEALDVGELLRSVVRSMSLAAREKNGEISLNLPQEGLKIEGDRIHLTNVFRNLIDNALKYCDTDPEITISVTETNNHVRVVFEDNGIGISAQDQSHIFEKFQRVNTGNVRQAKGFGIGLAYVKTVVELHKGLVQVKSELNKGSQFLVLIPNA